MAELVPHKTSGLQECAKGLWPNYPVKIVHKIMTDTMESFRFLVSNTLIFCYLPHKQAVDAFSRGWVTRFLILFHKFDQFIYISNTVVFYHKPLILTLKGNPIFVKLLTITCNLFVDGKKLKSVISSGLHLNYSICT